MSSVEGVKFPFTPDEMDNIIPERKAETVESFEERLRADPKGLAQETAREVLEQFHRAMDLERGHRSEPRN